MRSPDTVRFVVHADRLSITASKRAAQKNEGGIVMCVVPTNVADEPRQAVTWDDPGLDDKPRTLSNVDSSDLLRPFPSSPSRIVLKANHCRSHSAPTR